MKYLLIILLSALCTISAKAQEQSPILQEEEMTSPITTENFAGFWQLHHVVNPDSVKNAPKELITLLFLKKDTLMMVKSNTYKFFGQGGDFMATSMLTPNLSDVWIQGSFSVASDTIYVEHLDYHVNQMFNGREVPLRYQFFNSNCFYCIYESGGQYYLEIWVRVQRRKVAPPVVPEDSNVALTARNKNLTAQTLAVVLEPCKRFGAYVRHW
jgi:hypothetical protein